MKNIGFIYSSESSFEELINVNELSKEKEYLVRIHTCIHSADTIMTFVETILKYLPNSKIIGSSTSGIIIDGMIIDDKCLVSITEFKHSSVRTFLRELSAENENDISGNVLAEEVSKCTTEKSALMLAFFARPYLKIDEFVESMNTCNPSMQIIGGLANTPEVQLVNVTLRKSFVFNEKEVSCTSLACAVIDNTEMTVYSDVVYVTEPVGKVHTITDADGMIIRAVDGENAVDWYQNLLGVDLDKGGFNTTIVFPLVKENRSNIPWAISYSPQKEDNYVFEDEPEPVLYVLNEAKVGDRIRISYSSIQKSVEVCENVCEGINQHPSEVLFGYSCVSRQDMFKNCAKWELMPFKKTNLCGALVAGEIGNIKGVNRYCNYSFAIASLSESNSHVKLDIDTLENHLGELENSQENIINYLIQNSYSGQNENRAEQQREIEESLFIDDDTGLGNATKFIFDYNVGKFDKICVITIKNESLLKAFLSESKFMIYFNRYHKMITDFVSEEYFSCYIYKKNSLIITAPAEISDENFISKMESLQNYIADFQFSTYTPVSEFAIVMHEEDMIKKAELTLIRMRNKKLCFMQYTSELGLEKFNANKMKMIRILNDAISNNRVIPYFQGIRDNKSGNITMYESLMRIEDGKGNVYTPYQFMKISKEYGYYADISYMMINRVLEIFRDRKEQVTINMNISDIYNYKIVHSVLEFLRNAPRPENYIFELTETEEIEDYQVIFEFVEKVHEAGGKIAIDDFGSGFSNIVNVFKIKSDYIKIDGEIVKSIENDIFAMEFLEMISQWSQKHNKEIIAEFVENDNIQSIIEKNSIHFSQGYLFSKPSRLFLQ